MKDMNKKPVKKTRKKPNPPTPEHPAKTGALRCQHVFTPERTDSIPRIINGANQIPQDIRHAAPGPGGVDFQPGVRG